MKLFLAFYGLVAGMNGRVHEMSVKHNKNPPIEEQQIPVSKCSGVSDDACADKITWLPGLEQLPEFDMYSGYLHVS